MATDKFMTGISITFEEKAIVDEQKKKIGIDSFSLTLGMIIREWAALKSGMVTIPKIGIIKDGDKVVIDPQYLEDDLDKEVERRR